GGGVLRLLPGGGHDDRDRLPGVVDYIVLHREERLARCRAAQQRGDQRHPVHLRGVVVGEDPGHPASALGLCDIDRGDPAAGYLGADDLGVGQVRRRDLAAVSRCAGDLSRALDPGHILADESAHHASPSVSVLSARTMARCVSSTLNAFIGRGMASASSWRAASAKLAALAGLPSSAVSARRARQGLVATPPSASRTSATVPSWIRTAAATDTSANSYDSRSRNFR